MYTWDWALHVALFAVVATFTPGPNALLLTSVAAKFGLRAAVPVSLGVWFGIPTLIVVVGLGLGEVFAAFAPLQLVLHIAATAYLAWLTWTILTSKPPQDSVTESAPMNAVQAAALQWVNPKVWTMAVGVIGAYSVQRADAVSQALLVGLIFAVVCVPAVAVWTLFGAGLRRWLTSARRYLAFKLCMGVLLALSVVLTWTS